MTNDDRRNAPRYTPAQDQARLGWWDGGRFVSASARLRDISSSGVALRVDHDGPPPPRSVWVYLAGAGAGEWVPTDLAGSSTADGGAREVRLAFAGACPYEVFKAAVWGVPAPPQPAPVVTPAPALEAITDGSPLGDRAEAAGLAGGGFCSTVLAAADLAPTPTPWKAERARYAARRRSRALPWVAKLALGLGVVALLYVALAGRLDAVRTLGQRLAAGAGR